jgi:O-antigen/teichoic acid export membrane protein
MNVDSVPLSVGSPQQLPLPAAANRANLSTGSLLVKGTVFSMLGQGLPLVVAVVCLPIVVKGFGAERFGVLALSWAVLSSVGAFDLGLGRASARYIAAALSRGATEEVPRIFGTGLLAQGCIGIIGGSVVAAATPLLVVRLFALPPNLQSDGYTIVRLIALAVPLVLLSNSMRSALYAAQRFDLVNAVGVPASSSMYLLSAVGVLTGWTLPTTVAVLVASKAVALAALWHLTRRYCPGLYGRRLSTDWKMLRVLLRFGSWLTLSSLLSPLLSRAERLLIPALLSVAALTPYTVAYEALSRVTILPVSMALALFPAFSGFDAREGGALRGLVVRPARYLAVVMTPLLTFGALFARELLTVWMGPDFALQATAPLQLLAAAFYFGAFSSILRAAIQGLGRPDLKAKLDMGNAALFLVVLLALTPRFGLRGAAAARLIMTCTELGMLVVLAPLAAPRALRPTYLLDSLRLDVAAVVGFVTIVGVTSEWLRGSAFAYVAFALFTTGYFWVFWKWLADATDRRAAVHVAAALGLTHLGAWLPRRGQPG